MFSVTKKIKGVFCKNTQFRSYSRIYLAQWKVTSIFTGIYWNWSSRGEAAVFIWMTDPLKKAIGRQPWPGVSLDLVVALTVLDSIGFVERNLFAN